MMTAAEFNATLAAIGWPRNVLADKLGMGSDRACDAGRRGRTRSRPRSPRGCETSPAYSQICHRLRIGKQPTDVGNPWTAVDALPASKTPFAPTMPPGQTSAGCLYTGRAPESRGPVVRAPIAAVAAICAAGSSKFPDFTASITSPIVAHTSRCLVCISVTLCVA